jgi:hypothetical protein
MTELIQRLRKEATEQRKWAATFAPDLPWCVEDVGVWELDEVKHAATAVFHAANKALDLEQAAEALERLTPKPKAGRRGAYPKATCAECGRLLPLCGTNTDQPYLRQHGMDTRVCQCLLRVTEGPA